MALSKEEQVQLTELAAKAKGMTPEKYIENMAKEYGIEPAEAPTSAKTRRQERGDPNTRFIEKLLESGEKGDLSMDAMFDKLMKFSMMKMMAGGGMFGNAESKKSDLSAAEIIAANDEKWERRMAQDKAERKEEALQARLDKLDLLITSGEIGKKGDPMLDKVLEEIKETKAELKEAEKARIKAEMDAKDARFSQYQEDTAARLEAIENREPQKTAEELLIEEDARNERYERLMTKWGKAHGWSTEKINKEISETKPMWQQMLQDVTGEGGLLDKLIRIKYGEEKAKEKEQPEVAEVTDTGTQIICAGCGQPSDNNTKICSACQEIALAETERLRAQEQAAKPEPAKEEPVTVQVEEPVVQEEAEPEQ